MLNVTITIYVLHILQKLQLEFTYKKGVSLKRGNPNHPAFAGN